MQEKPFYVHIELHKKIVKNAWIISYEERKILAIEFQETVTEDESVAYVFALAKSLVSEKNTKYIKQHCYSPAIYEIATDTGLSKATIRRHITMMLEDHILETEHPGDSRAYRIKGTKIVMVKEKKTNGNDNSK